MEVRLSCGPAGLGVMVAQEGEQVPEGLAPGPNSDSPSHAEGQHHPEKRAESAPGARLALRPPLTGRPTGSKIIPVISLLGFKASFKIAVYPTSWKTIAFPHVAATSHTYLMST